MGLRVWIVMTGAALVVIDMSRNSKSGCIGFGEDRAQ